MCMAVKPPKEVQEIEMKRSLSLARGLKGYDHGSPEISET